MGRAKVIYIYILFVFFTGALSYSQWGDIMPTSMVNKILIFSIIGFTLIASKRRIYNTPLPKYVMMLAFIPFISMFGAHIFHGQSWTDCINATLFNLSYLIFFLLVRWDIQEKDLVKMIIVFGCIYSLIELLQEFTYPKVWFYAQKDLDSLSNDVRNGLYRFRMAGIDFAVLLFFYSFQTLTKKINTKHLILLLIGAIGVYLSLTRQIMVASIGSAVLVYVFAKKNKFRNIIILLVVFSIIYVNADVLFGSFVEQTNDELDSDYIRFLSYNYFGIEWNNGNVLKSLIGNGFPYYNISSPYGREIENLHSIGLFASDVGIVGMYALYGVFYVAICVGFLVYAFRNFRYIEPYVKMYLLFMTFTIVMLWSFGMSAYGTTRTALIMYLIYLNIKKNKSKYVEKYPANVIQ